VSQPAVIQIGEPWRNGVIERFNDTYGKKLFRRQWVFKLCGIQEAEQAFSAIL